MTILLVVICLVAGIALGQWFKILILVPVMSLALVGTIAAGIARAIMLEQRPHSQPTGPIRDRLPRWQAGG